MIETEDSLFNNNSLDDPEERKIGSRKWKSVTSMEKPPVNNSDEDFLVEYNGKKYDIQELLALHPGGRNYLKAYKGLSLDTALRNTPHSTAALHLFEEFLLTHENKYQEIENLVDWRQPLLRQVSSLKGNYWEWVNLPVNRPIRLFQSNFLELLTITPWCMIPLIWVPTFLYFFYLGFRTNTSEHIVHLTPTILLSFVSGVLIWTLLEYALHRKLFHLKPPDDSKTLITLHFLLHGVHHKAPFDGRRLLFPPFPAILIGLCLLYCYKIIFPQKLVYFIAAGTAVGYLFYDLTHYYLHYGKPRPSSYFYDLKRYHNYHHFSHHEEGFGISNKLWDYVFSTMITLRNLTKAIEW